MKRSFEQLKSMVVFAAIVEQGSFSAASKSLNISRSSVSYHIKKLEQQLGVKLFYRSTRSISLTDTGSRYYQRCRVVVEQAQRAQQDIENFKQEPEGKIKLSCAVGVGVALVTPMVSEFKRIYPKIEIELLLTDRVINLVSEGVDTVFAVRQNRWQIRTCSRQSLRRSLCAYVRLQTISKRMVDRCRQQS